MRFVSLLTITTLLLGGCISLPTQTEDNAAGPATARAGDKPALHESFDDAATARAYQAALASMRRGEMAAARTQMEQVIEQSPSLAGPRVNLGILLLNTGDYPAAEATLHKAVEIAPKSAIAQAELALALRHLGRFREAEAAYLAALANDPDYALAHRNVGILYDLYLQQPQQALSHYQRYRELDPGVADEVGSWIADVQNRLQQGAK